MKDLTEYQRRLHSYVQREGLTSIMNDTKWAQLFKALEGIQDVLDFRRKDVRDRFDSAKQWDSDIYMMFGLSEKIEWLDIRAKVFQPRGALLKPVIEDHTETLVKAVRSAGVPFSRIDEGVRIWGYVRPGISPEWA